MGTRTCSYYTGTMTGQTGSLITALKAICVTGEGWTNLYESGNKIVLQQAGGSGYVLRVVDDGTLAAGAREATVRAAESASDVDTLTDAFPTTALLADANCVWRKSDSTDSTARNYYAVADDRFVVLVVAFGGSTVYDCYFFGDLDPVWTGDVYACGINSRGLGNQSTTNRAMSGMVVDITTTSTAEVWFARTSNGLVKTDRGAIVSVSSSRVGNMFTGNAYPDVGSLKLNMRRLMLRSNGGSSTAVGTGTTFRALLPFFMEAMFSNNVTSLSPLDTFTATDYDASSQFIIFAANGLLTDGNTSRYILQTAGTWKSN